MKINEEIRKYGKENKVPITLDDTLSFLLETININKSKEILEVGTAIGRCAKEISGPKERI